MWTIQDTLASEIGSSPRTSGLSRIHELFLQRFVALKIILKRFQELLNRDGFVGVDPFLNGAQGVNHIRKPMIAAPDA